MRKKFLITTLAVCISCILGSLSGYAYNIWMRGGFSPIPAYVYCYSGFSSETLAAVHNGCLAWNNGGQGGVVFRSTSTHNTTTWPYINAKNEITKGARGTNEYLMAAHPSGHIATYLTEVDIDINVSRPFGTADTSYDTRTCITHELGHLLGLDEMPTGRSNVMYYEREPGERVHALSADDKAGLAAIYAD